MKKKIIISTIIAVCLALSLTLAVIADKIIKDEGKKMDFTLLKDGELIETIASSDAYSTAISELNSYPFVDFTTMLRPRATVNNGFISTTSSVMQYLRDFEQAFPIKSMKKIDENNVLVTYKLDRDGTPVYAYVVFTKQTMHYETKDGVDEAGDYENWCCYGEYYFAVDSVPYERYSALKAGDSITSDELQALAIYSDSRYICRKDEKGAFVRDEICLLNEGILTLSFKWGEAEINAGEDIESVILTDAKFYPYDEKSEYADKVSTLLKNNVVELPRKV